jgi:hypothetical protein
MEGGCHCAERCTNCRVVATVYSVRYAPFQPRPTRGVRLHGQMKVAPRLR